VKTLTYFLKIILINTSFLGVLWRFWGKSRCTKRKT